MYSPVPYGRTVFPNITLVLNCGWYAHAPSVWIKGTEDMKSEYQNYKFYLSSIPRSIAAGVAVAVLVGVVIMITGGNI